jgi:hypothetical protein
MNGRVYDPLLGRFGTPDPTTENPFSTQGWNRYSYVGNSPLNFTDPSGYCFMGCIWQKPFKAIGALLRKFPIIGQIIQVAAVAICTAATFGACSPIAAAVLSSAVTAGLASGNLGAALRAGLIAAASAVAFNFVGDITLGANHAMPEFLSGQHLANIVGHAAVGCLMASASGGKCRSGALSGGVGALATPVVGKFFPNPETDDGDLFGGTATTAVVGDVASIAGGGKFGNGAVTAAFGYMFNALAGRLAGRWTGRVFGGALCAEAGPGAAVCAIVGGAVGGQLGSDLEDFLRGGVIVWNDPPEIKGFTDHGWERMQQDGLTPKDLNDALNNPKQRIPQHDDTTVYVGKTATVVLNESNEVVTVWRTGTFR